MSRMPLKRDEGCGLVVQGDKVKFTLQFKGREVTLQEEGTKIMEVRVTSS